MDVLPINGIQTYKQWWEAEILTKTILQVIKAAEAHLMLATKERSYYRTQCSQSKTVLRDAFTENQDFTPPPVLSRPSSMSKAITVHFSFDMAQQVHYAHWGHKKHKYMYITILPFTQVHYPSNPLQPGPVYFLTPRKYAVFGDLL